MLRITLLLPRPHRSLSAVVIESLRGKQEDTTFISEQSLPQQRPPAQRLPPAPLLRCCREGHSNKCWCPWCVTPAGDSGTTVGGV